MKPIRAMKCYISEDLPPLHMLFTEEEGVVVVRCLDFSISSHGEDIPDAIESINSALIDYIKHGIERGDVESIFDPELKMYWDWYKELEIEKERDNFKEQCKDIEKDILEKGLIYA